MTTDANNLVNVCVGTSLGIFDHCCASCVLRVEKSVLEYNIRSTVYRTYHTNWDNVRCAVRSFTWSKILKSVDPLDAFDRTIVEVIRRLVRTTVLHSRSGDKRWFDASCRKNKMLSRLLILPGVEHAVQIIGVDLCLLVLRPRGSMMLQMNHITNAPLIL